MKKTIHMLAVVFEKEPHQVLVDIGVQNNDGKIIIQELTAFSRQQAIMMCNDFWHPEWRNKQTKPKAVPPTIYDPDKK